jgi:hypothetical protein
MEPEGSVIVHKNPPFDPVLNHLNNLRQINFEQNLPIYVSVSQLIFSLCFLVHAFLIFSIRATWKGIITVVIIINITVIIIVIITI